MAMQTTISGSPFANLARVMDHQRANKDDSVAALPGRIASAEPHPALHSFHRRVEQTREPARFSVRTHDGDKIEIELKSREMHSSALKTQGGLMSARETSRFIERFEVRCEGHIDEDERAAKMSWALRLRRTSPSLVAVMTWISIRCWLAGRGPAPR